MFSFILPHQPYFSILIYFTFSCIFYFHFMTSSVSASVCRFASPPNAPSFGALTNQSAPSFGSLAQQGSGFGSQPSSFSGFGQQPQAVGETATSVSFFAFLCLSSLDVPLLTSSTVSGSRGSKRYVQHQ